MTVARILNAKGGDVATIAPGRTLQDAAYALAEHRIGALVVAEADRKVQGIISERDIIRAVATSGDAALTHEVRTHMTAKVQTCTTLTSVNEVMTVMTQGKFRHLPVVENGILIGIVSIGDVVKKRLADMENEHKAMREYIVTA